MSVAIDMFKGIPTDDREIVTAVRNKNSEGWNQLIAKYDPMIKSIVRWQKWNFSKEEQEDVTQEIHVQLQSAIPKFRQQCTLSWFIKKIAVHQCVNEIRRQVRWRNTMVSSFQEKKDGSWSEVEFEDKDTPDPYFETSRQERFQAFNSAMMNMNETCQKAIELFYLQQLTYREISRKLGIAVNTVGSRLSKCLDKLHTKLRPYFPSERI